MHDQVPRPSVAATPSVRPDTNHVDLESPDDIGPKTNATPIATFTRRPATARARILVVDNGIIIAEDIRRRLEAMAYHVVDIAASGIEAIKRAEATRPDLVLMDIRLDGSMDGIDAAKKITSLYNIPVVFVTAYSDDATLARVKGVGSYGLVIKPVEIRELGMVIDLALHKHAAEQILKRSEERHRDLLDSSPDALIVVDATGLITTCSIRTLDILGASAKEDLIGTPFHDYVYHEDRESIGTFLSRVNTGTHPELTECRLIRLQGEAADVEINAARASCDHLRTEEVLLSVRDISHRKKREERSRLSRLQQTLLLREVHHRTKNNLAAITSLLNLEAHSVEDKDALAALKESRTRIEAIALIHHQLSQAEAPAIVSFHEYAAQLASLLFRAYGVLSSRIALTLTLAELSLSIEKAIPVGIILNELVSNSLKHAFPDKRKGEIVVDLQISPERQVSLSVCDNGIGLPFEEHAGDSASLGLDLVRMLTSTLGGSLSMCSEKGTSVRVSFPASERRN